MKRYTLALALLVAAGVSTPALAQERAAKTRSSNVAGDRENAEVIIRTKKGENVKLVVEVKDGAITVNGKPVDDFRSEEVDVILRNIPTDRVSGRVNSIFRGNGPSVGVGPGAADYFSGGLSSNDGPMLYTTTSKAFLGVTTETAGDDDGAEVLSISKKSAAETAGLEAGDVITHVDDISIGNPTDLSKAIGKFKPKDKVTLTIKRDGKELKKTATLGSTPSYALTYDVDQKYNGLNYQPQPGIAALENLNYWRDGMNLAWGRPRLGIRAQDTEEGKGVKVLDVMEGSLAESSGVKEGDLILEFDGKKVNSADELSEVASDAREKTVVPVLIQRNGKSQTIEIKTPKKLKTTNL